MPVCSWPWPFEVRYWVSRSQRLIQFFLTESAIFYIFSSIDWVFRANIQLFQMGYKTPSASQTMTILHLLSGLTCWTRCSPEREGQRILFANKAEIDAESIGRIEIYDSDSTVDIPEGVPREKRQGKKKSGEKKQKAGGRMKRRSDHYLCPCSMKLRNFYLEMFCFVEVFFKGRYIRGFAFSQSGAITTVAPSSS